jgi:hypothetical protein
MFQKYLNQDEQFINGYWKGENLEDVASEVPDYLEELLEDGDLSSTEEESIREALERNRI